MNMANAPAIKNIMAVPARLASVIGMGVELKNDGDKYPSTAHKTGKQIDIIFLKVSAPEKVPIFTLSPGITSKPCEL